ncbi:MAG TPA: ISAs1 family transposase [Chloroflexota bacterium]|nr:ISAs1 family transposase [Chloroflexota bacterium]
MSEQSHLSEEQEAWFATILDLPHGTPAHDTFGRVFAALDPDQFEACFREWVAGVGARLGLDRAGDGAGRVVALDGKTLRRSHDRRRGTAALHLVSAWASEARLVLAQRAAHAKASELGALPAVLQLLALEGCIVTIDAMGTHTSSAQAIVDKEADYVLALGFVTAHPAVTSAILGPRTLDHLHAQLAAADTVLSADVIDAIDAIVAPGVDLAAHEKFDTSPALLDPSLRRR